MLTKPVYTNDTEPLQLKSRLHLIKSWETSIRIIGDFFDASIQILGPNRCCQILQVTNNSARRQATWWWSSSLSYYKHWIISLLLSLLSLLSLLLLLLLLLSLLLLLLSLLSILSLISLLLWTLYTLNPNPCINLLAKIIWAFSLKMSHWVFSCENVPQPYLFSGRCKLTLMAIYGNG